MPRRALVAIFALLLCVAAPAATSFAKIKLDIETGWEEKFRPGKWTPLFITLQDNSPRQVVVEVYCPTDRRYALKIGQGLTISPQPVTIPIYVPLSYRTDETTITISDANTGRRLESLILTDYPLYQGMGGPKQVDPQALFVLISGTSGSERMLQGQMRHQNVETSFTPISRLPLTPAGYDCVDLLLLNQPELARLNEEQQSALANWVRAGGLLVINPGAAPVPTVGPIAEMLPARLGPTKQLDIDSTAIQKAGLPNRFAKLTARDFVDVAPDARTVPLFDPSGPQSLRRWVGMGQVMILGADVSSLLFDNPDKAIAFWRDALKGVAVIDVNTDPNNRNSGYYYGMTDNPVRATAIRQTLDWIGDVPGAGSFGFSYVAIVLLAMMFIVGPVDWFVLKWTNRQPWTWVTITGWIGLVTLGSIYIGHVFKSGEVHFRTASVIDEAGSMRVAAVDFAGLYSPQTTEYPFEYSPYGWWRTSSVTNPYGGGGSGLLTEVACHQDYRGNRPLPMLINVWNVRFLEGQELGDAPAFVQAQLTGSQRHLLGSITNRAPFALRDVLVRTRAGVGKIEGELAPGATANVDVIIKSDTSLAAATQMSNQDQWQMYNTEIPTTQPTAQSLNNVADLRTARIDQQLNDRDDVVCIYATYDASPDERLKLTAIKVDKQAHTGVIRSLVPVARQ